MNGPIKEWAHYAKQALDERTVTLINMARFDLSFGPGARFYDTADEQEADVEYVGFESACREIRNAIDPLIFNATITDDDGIEWHIAPRDAKRALLGDLAEYI